MPSQQLIDFIDKGLKEGRGPAELQLHAVHDMGVSVAEFNQALDQVMLGELHPASQAAPLSAPESPVFQAETAPTPKKVVGFFNPFGWFKHHKVTAVLLVLIVAVLAAGGAVLANVLMTPSTDQIRLMVFERLQNMKTVEYEGSLEGEITTDAMASLDTFLRYGPQHRLATKDRRVAGSKNTKVRLDFKGASDVRDSANPKAETTLTLTSEGFVVGVDAKAIGEDVFFKIRELPDLGMFDTTAFLNQWFKLDYEGLGAAGLSYVPATAGNLDESKKRRIMEIVANSSIFKLAEKIGNDEVDGKSAYHYRYTIDEVALLETIQQVVKEIDASANPELTAKERQEFLDWIDAAGGEIWLAKKDLVPLQMTFDLAMRSVNDAPVTGRLSLNIKFNKYNQNVTIEPPYPFKNLSEMLSETMAEVTPTSRDEQRVTDIRSLQTALEMYWQDYGVYPNTLEQLLSAKYPIMIDLPAVAEPPDGACTIEQNKYKYKPTNNYKDYQLTFCLGAKSGNLSPGVRTASANGIR
jgi:hypothetical protein